ncbi:MAG: hypothetical protein C4324_09535 [Blastocatellia bacterium]
MFRRIFGPLFLIALIAFPASLRAQEDPPMTNEDVISLTKAGLAPAIIIGKIRAAKTKFDLSTDSLLKLKSAGVSDDVVAAMLEAKSGKPVSSNSVPAGDAAADPNDPLSKHNYGIYLYEEVNGQRKMTQLMPNVAAQNRIGGVFTAAVTPFGLGKVKAKANLPGRNASLQITTTQPVFYFYLDVASGGLNTASGIPSTPNEFTLIRFGIRGDNREVTIAKVNSWGGKGGVSDEYVIGLKAEDVGNGIFRVTPAVELKKGEYAFYLVNSGNSNVNAGVGAKFFDFGVNPVP